MHLASVTHAVPGRVIDNQYVLEQLRAANASRFDARELKLIEGKVEQYLEAAGTQRRYKLGADEHGMDLTLDAAERALAAAGVSRGDVDFVLYVGVGRGWVEPAVANVVQAKLGLASATCFDVIDACTSWIRALQIAHSFIRTSVYRCVLIVNCECAFVTYQDWQLESLGDLEHRMAEWTIGEAATATVVTARDDDDWHFNFRNFGEHFDVCLFPLPEVAERFVPGVIDRRHAPMRLFSLSRPLMTVATAKLAETFSSDPRLRDAQYDVIFGHAASDKAISVLSRRLGIPEDVYFPTHARFGNTVSASIPLAMSLALDEGRLARGQKVLLMAAASGISIGLASFTF